MILAGLGRIEFEEDRRSARDLRSFAYSAWNILEPSTPLAWNWHLDLIAEYLQLVRTSQITRLILNVPPRTMKSRLATVIFPAWWWLTDPSRAFMSVSYSKDLTATHSRERREVLQSKWFGEITTQPFHWKVQAENEYSNDCGGHMLATSVGGSVTGRGANCIILDDLVSAKQAESEADRSSAIRFIDQTLRSRLNDPVKGSMIVVEQRLHEIDVTGHLLAVEPERWTLVKLPMIAEQDETIVFPITKRTFVRKKGDLLWPERFPEWSFEAQRRSTRLFSSQYQQRPTPAEGIIFNPANWKYYARDRTNVGRPGPNGEPLEAAPRFEQLIISADCSFKDTIDSDNVAIHVYAFVQNRIYLIERDTCQRGFSSTENVIKAKKAFYSGKDFREQGWPSPSTLLVEDKANGSAIIEVLRRTSLNMAVIAINPEGGKVARAWAAQPDQEVGNCYLPGDDETTPLFVEDMAKFRGEGSIPHDDDVDAFTQLVNWRRMHSMGFFDRLKERYDEMTSGNGSKKLAPSDPDSGVSPEEIAKRNTEIGMVTAAATNASVGRVFGQTVQKVSFSGMTKPATNPQTPKCPECGNVNLSRREDHMGNKLISCGLCGWKNSGAMAK